MNDKGEGSSEPGRNKQNQAYNWSMCVYIPNQLREQIGFHQMSEPCIFVDSNQTPISSTEEYVTAYERIKQSGVPNYKRCRIPVHSDFNIAA